MVRPGPARRGTRRQRGPASGAGVALPLMVLYAGAIAAGVWLGHLPWGTPAASALLQLLAFFAYWQDKHAAERGRWRIQERTLHLWSLAGGWAGAWFAQQVLRHKSAKASFRQVYWATVVLHCAALAWFGWWRLGSPGPA